MIKLTIFSNSLNHHQVALADEFYSVLGDSFKFVITCPSFSSDLKGGENYKRRLYCVAAGDSEDKRREALYLSRESEVCIFGAASQIYAIERAMKCPTKLSFEMGERWLKKGVINVLSSNFLVWIKNYYQYFRKANFYKLCMSAFASSDEDKLRCYVGRHYKWGYFVEANDDRELVNNEFCNNDIKLLWCSRFLKWKHPELAIQLASRLLKRGIPFHLNMIGDGCELEAMKKLSNDLNLTPNVTFLGNLSNTEVRNHMLASDIFLFTSDRNEGWGVVANEAMGQYCSVVASDEIGCVPYLIDEPVNGMVFESRNIDSLTEKVLWLIDHPVEIINIKTQAHNTIKEIWSAKNAVKNFLFLTENLRSGGKEVVLKGPCSKA